VELVEVAALVDDVADDELELLVRLCSSACTIVFKKSDLPTPPDFPAPPLPSLSPSESVPPTCWVELDELAVCCNQAK
jgi:hypothetical protein